ncbi:MAG: hypothetical protein WBA91_11595, partial [Paracoccaceae bacterium]
TATPAAKPRKKERHKSKPAEAGPRPVAKHKTTAKAGWAARKKAEGVNPFKGGKSAKPGKTGKPGHPAKAGKPGKPHHRGKGPTSRD